MECGQGGMDSFLGRGTIPAGVVVEVRELVRSDLATPSRLGKKQQNKSKTKGDHFPSHITIPHTINTTHVLIQP